MAETPPRADHGANDGAGSASGNAGAGRSARGTVPWRTIVATISVAASAYVAWLLLIASQRIITWLVVAAFFAVVLSPPVDLLVHRARFRRTLAALIVFLVGFAVVAGLLYLVIAPIVNEVTKFVNDFPRLVADAQAGRGPVGHLVQRYDLVNKAQHYGPQVQKYLSSSGTQALTIVRRVGNGLVAVLTILVLTVLLLVEGPTMIAGGLRMLSPERQERLTRVGRSSARAITGYMAGNLLISVIASLVTYVGLWVFGVPFLGVAALWVGFADLIPLIGATLGAVPTVGLAFLHSIPAGIGMIIIYVVYQQFENHVLQVTIMARTVKLSPLAVLVSVLVGVQLFGLLGALLAIPAAGIIHVIAVDVYTERQRAKGAAVLADPASAAAALSGAGLSGAGLSGAAPSAARAGSASGRDTVVAGSDRDAGGAQGTGAAAANGADHGEAAGGEGQGDHGERDVHDLETGGARLVLGDVADEHHPHEDGPSGEDTQEDGGAAAHAAKR